jgi:hypothetical protein
LDLGARRLEREVALLQSTTWARIVCALRRSPAARATTNDSVSNTGSNTRAGWAGGSECPAAAITAKESSLLSNIATTPALPPNDHAVAPTNTVENAIMLETAVRAATTAPSRNSSSATTNARRLRSGIWSSCGGASVVTAGSWRATSTAASSRGATSIGRLDG